VQCDNWTITWNIVTVKKLILVQQVKNFPYLTETGSLLPYSQEHVSDYDPLYMNSVHNFVFYFF